MSAPTPARSPTPARTRTGRRIGFEAQLPGAGAIALAAVVVVGLVLASRGAYLALLAPALLLVAGYLLIRHLDAATSIFAIILYTNAPVVAVQFHHVPFVIAAAFPLLLCIPIARDLCLRGKLPVFAPALPFVLAYFAVQLAGALFAIRPEESMDGLLTFVLEGLLLYLLVTNAVRTPAVLRQVLWSLLAAGSAMGALVLYQQLTGSFDDNFGGFAQIDTGAKGFVVGVVDEMRQKRLGGPLGMPNRFAQVMGVLIPIALFQIYASRTRGGKLLAGAALGLVAVGSALGFSRGAFVALTLVSPAILVLSRVKLRHLLVAAAGVACVGLLVPQYLVRLASLGAVAELASEDGGVEDTDSSVQGRITEMAAAALMFADHPLVGVGPDMYPEHYNEYARVAGGRVRDGTREAHSMPLHIGAENGMLGLATLGGVIWVTLRDLVRARRRAAARQPELERLVSGVLLGLCVYLGAALFLHASYIRYLWFLLALGAATARVASDADALSARRLVRLVRVPAVAPPAGPA